MKKILLILVPLFLTTSCQDQSVEPTENSSWTFVANEGDFGASNGSVSMIDDNGNIFETESLGDIVQSLAVYENKLIVLINNSHKINNLVVLTQC